MAKTEPPERPRTYWWMPLAAGILGPLLRLLFASYRVRVVEGSDVERHLLETREPAIFACWHNRQAVGGGWILRLALAGYPMVGMVSRSRDGELLARMVRWSGIRLVRGSTSRGALSSVLKLFRVLVREGSGIALAPDGPRGPVYKAQSGVVLLARLSGLPIIPVAGAQEKYWRLRSWDRLFVPKPFSRVAVAVGEPYHVSTESVDDEAETQSLEEKLNELVDRAEAALR